MIANCLIGQSHLDELNGADSSIKKRQNAGETSGTSNNVETLGMGMLEAGNLAVSPSLISELCQAYKIEAKTKIQQMLVDCLALCLDIS